jgi:uncharacterized protein
MIQTALVTGASSGIGRALALKLAREKYQLLLIARDTEALAKLALECKNLGSGRVEVLAVDLSQTETFSKIEHWLKEQGWEIDLLVNNAGFGMHGFFPQTDLAVELAMIRVQIDALVSLTKMVLPSMIRRQKGQILNVGSVYSFSPVPFQSVYSACKAFLLSFSESIAAEVHSHGITVTALCPGITYTSFRSRQGLKEKISRFGMTAELVAAIGYRGLQRGQRIVVPGVWNWLYVTVARHLPVNLVPSLIALINQRRGLPIPPR